jgi:hypothetical protein
MPDNRVSANLGEAERQHVLAAIETIRQNLPSLIDLTPEERRSLPRMGDRSRGFVAQALKVATLNPGILPLSFDVGEIRNDVGLYSTLSSVSSPTRSKKLDEELPEDIAEPVIGKLPAFGEVVMKRLDPLVRETYADKPDSLAEWDEITHMCDDLEDLQEGEKPATPDTEPTNIS